MTKGAIALVLAVLAFGARAEEASVNMNAERPERIPQGPLKVVLSFDDAVMEHYSLVAPELEKRGWRGIFCIVTDWVGREKKMSWDEIRDLVNRGHEIASHTMSHVSLARLAGMGDKDALRREIAGSRDIITREAGVRPRLLCLPFTSYHPLVGTIAAEEGMEVMLVHRLCLGGAQPANWTRSQVAVWRKSGKSGELDFCVHGVTKEGGGWNPFDSTETFLRHLDEVKAAEKAGEAIVWNYVK